jgi:hypothetical protein
MMRPEINPEVFKPGLRAVEVGRHMTPRTFVRVTMRLIEAKASFRAKLGECACGKGTFEDSRLAPELVCQGCGRVEELPSGDDVLIADLRELTLR